MTSLVFDTEEEHCCIPSQAQVSVGAYIKLLGEQGITGIISMQTTSRGQYSLTVGSYEKAKLLVLNGFDEGEQG